MSGDFSTCNEFRQAVQTPGQSKPARKKRPAPLSIRVSDEEREKLKVDAAGGSIHGYVRNRLFGADASSSIRVRRGKTIDHEILGRVLGALGQSRLSSNINQIAKAANIGALPVTPELTATLHEVCTDIRAMRRDLIMALGIKS
jgi:Mobilization protein NikA